MLWKGETLLGALAKGGKGSDPLPEGQTQSTGFDSNDKTSESLNGIRQRPKGSSQHETSPAYLDDDFCLPIHILCLLE